MDGGKDKERTGREKGTKQERHIEGRDTVIWKYEEKQMEDRKEEGKTRSEQGR
jgi:hypothetical protein